MPNNMELIFEIAALEFMRKNSCCFLLMSWLFSNCIIMAIDKFWSPVCGAIGGGCRTFRKMDLVEGYYITCAFEGDISWFICNACSPSIFEEMSSYVRPYWVIMSYTLSPAPVPVTKELNQQHDVIH
ncbi:hypothetical protein H671_5g13691 [Cricetulus griseus]|uniref:Uncharacterized protein n=1 Tax=Cricetulus griseus TaxID=10029 RepID=A0A061I4M5_CRIGR|nr:hypothetical protein H671_5g13691 [Cricetulus griseus]